MSALRKQRIVAQNIALAPPGARCWCVVCALRVHSHQQHYPRSCLIIYECSARTRGSPNYNLCVCIMRARWKITTIIRLAGAGRRAADRNIMLCAVYKFLEQHQIDAGAAHNNGYAQINLIPTPPDPPVVTHMSHQNQFKMLCRRTRAHKSNCDRQTKHAHYHNRRRREHSTRGGRNSSSSSSVCVCAQLGALARTHAHTTHANASRTSARSVCVRPYCVPTAKSRGPHKCAAPGNGGGLWRTAAPLLRIYFM